MTSKKIKCGIVANEFFDTAVSGMGGFGWLAREIGVFFSKNPNEGIEPIFLSGEQNQLVKQTYSNGVPFLFAQENWEEYVKLLRAQNIDVLFTIDYRPNYDFAIAALPDTPLIVWIQDPRPPEDIRKVNSLKIPGVDSGRVEGIHPIDCTPLTNVIDRARSSGRKVVFASPAPTLIKKVKGTYGFDLSSAEMHFVPYPLNIIPRQINKSENPRVVFLGRLDPIKRPWIFVELAKHFPEVEFCVLGKAHFQGEGAWSPSDAAQNLKFLGHVDGEEKHKLLSTAWILINTSIHEALPVSFLEALLYEMPIISCQNPEDIVSRFGFYTGQLDDDGLQGLSQFIKGLKTILQDQSLRVKLGKEGRGWVEANHSVSKFVSKMQSLTGDVQSGSRTTLERRKRTVGDEIPEPWGVPELSFRYYRVKANIQATIPKNEAFVLVDENKLPLKFPNNKVFPFIEKDGIYYGAPNHDETAIQELKRLQDAGAKYIVIAWPAFWWLAYYKKFNSYLSNYRSVTKNELLVIFELKHNK